MRHEPAAGGVLVAGTSSDAGKSTVCAGLCRALARRGLRVAPFKAQNMALNSAVTAEGGEIGRAQAAQAAAAGVSPEVAMNPILLKPSGERESQVVVLGRPYAQVDARGYQALKSDLLPIVLEALDGLRARFDVVVCEGAGSPAEVNLRDNDIVNMGLARAAGLPVVVVGDIDRGGVFASLFGSLALLGPDDQRLVAGFLINKFRGDPGVLEPGLERLTTLTGRRVLGVLPWQHGLWLDVEDSLALDGPREGPLPPLGPDGIEIAVVRLPWMSNFTDFDALAAEPGVAVRFTQSPTDLRRADLVVVPGTKATVDDLAFLRERRLDAALRERADGDQPVLGICGGYQMLGRTILDEVESSAGLVAGLGLLPVETRFEAEKMLAQVSGRAPGFGDVRVAGYEIHHGTVTRLGGQPLLAAAAGDEGCRVGAVLGTAWHGVLEHDEFRRALLRWVAETRGLDWRAGSRPFRELREGRLDRLGDLVSENADVDALLELAMGGAPEGLPLLSVERDGRPVSPPALTRS
jgi:adenosylcobyric acid synthase